MIFNAAQFFYLRTGIESNGCTIFEPDRKIIGYGPGSDEDTGSMNSLIPRSALERSSEAEDFGIFLF